jgi:hypothetical protein
VASVQALESRWVLSPPTVPGTPVLTGLGATSATIAWGASTDTVALKSYSVYWIYTTGHSGRGGGITTHTILEATTDGSTTSATISGLAQNTTYTLYVKATDVNGSSSGYSAPVRVTPGALPSGLSAAEVGSSASYSFSVVANHELDLQLSASSFNAITYSVLNPPAGMTVDQASGLVAWTPDASMVGTTTVTFQATNAFGTTSLTVPITISADVPVPGFTFTNTDSPTFNVVGEPIGLQITDGSHTPSTFSVVSAPANVSIDPVTGVVNWVPTADQVGNAPLTFQLTNSAGTATITVNPVIYIADAPQNVTVTGTDTLSPVLSWSPPVDNSLVAGYRVMISGPDYSQYTFTTDASTLSVPLSLWSYPATYQVNIQALDAQGNEGLWNTSLSFDYAPNVPNPTYAFTSNGGASYAVVGQPTTIQVTDQNTSLPSTFTLLSGPDGMTVDPDTGLVSWTPSLSDLGGTQAVIAVTNAIGETDEYVSIPVYFASQVNNVAASMAPGGGAVNVTFAAPTFAGEPIAGYNIYVSWRGDEGGYGYASAFAAAGATSATVPYTPGNAESLVVIVVAVDDSGNEGAYPDVGTTVGGG